MSEEVELLKKLVAHKNSMLEQQMQMTHHTFGLLMEEKSRSFEKTWLAKAPTICGVLLFTFGMGVNIGQLLEDIDNEYYPCIIDHKLVDQLTEAYEVTHPDIVKPLLDDL